jgi:two-component system, response regulator
MFHLLLAEDNPVDVLLVREALRRSSIAVDVMIAYDGEEALKLLQEPKLKPDLILLDLNIPKVDGFAVLEQHHIDDGPPVVVFTSSTNPADKQRALELGAQDYFVKPVDFHQFLDTVQEIVERLTENSSATA